MSKVLKSYLKRLTNISSKNKSIVLSRLTKEQFLDLHDLDQLLNVPSFEILYQVFQRRKRIPICDVQDPRYEKVNLISKTLRKIARTEAFIAEEQGSTDLYIGYPFIRGKFANGNVLHAPLLFFPVSLEINNGQWCLICRNDVGVVLNRSFALAYSQFNEVAIGDDILDTPFEDFPINATLFKTDLYKWLKESPFNINFNQSLFDDKLSYFDAQRVKDLELLEKTGEIKLYPEAVLGIFPQAGSYLEPDYHQLIQQNSNPFSSKSIEATSSPVKEEELLVTFPTDLSQENAIKLVKQGKSIVIEGPPGTGKSQVICNLMADFAARGKKVLLVCQKKAALDVVYQRLKEANLSQYAALVHDYKNDRSEVFAKLASQIETIDDLKQANYALDAVVQERQFYQDCRHIDCITEELSTFKKALFDTSDAGVSIKELYLTSNQDGQIIPLNDLLPQFKMSDAENFRSSVRNYFDYSLLIPPTHPWKNRKSFASYQMKDLSTIILLIENFGKFTKDQSITFKQLAGGSFKQEDFQYLGLLDSSIDYLLEQINEPTIYNTYRTYIQSSELSEERLTKLTSIIDNLKKVSKIETTIPSNKLKEIQAKLSSSLTSKSSFIGGMFWNLFGEDKDLINSLATKNNLSTKHHDLATLLEYVNNRISLEKWTSDPVIAFDQNNLPLDLPFKERYISSLKRSLSAAQAVYHTANQYWDCLLQQIAEDYPNFLHFKQVLIDLKEWINAWINYFTNLDQWLESDQIEHLVDAPESYGNILTEHLQADFDNLVEMDRLYESLNEKESTILERLSALGTSMNLLEPHQFVELFEQSIHFAWIQYLEEKSPILRSVSSLKMQQLEEELQERIQNKERLSNEIIQIKLRELLFHSLQKNRLGNTVSYREVYHQTTKKRRIWPIRKLIDHYSEDIFKLIPCWMASPESVSVLFPLQENLFDLVIFDEASQCFAEYALPAAFRGKQIVIAGDSQQLQPFDLYRTRYEEPMEEEDEIQIELEISSLLDLASQYYEKVQLTGHYRSLSLDLIEFSNHYFYNSKLRLLPEFNYINTQSPGIIYEQIAGVWESGTNLAEAQKVVETLRSLENQDQTVGVITFNFPQQQLIQELVEQAGISIPSLFIKNIENVQGDERDIILFSLTYAPDKHGRVSMNFGTLNNKGGENRLNVAITRAKSKIMLITSLSPSQLQVENSSNIGPKLLRAYMEYALRVSNGEFVPIPYTSRSANSTVFLKNHLKNTNEGVVEELPFADLTVKQNGQYKGLLLTDDQLYHDSESAKEPHAYLPIHLKRRGWPFQRVYSRDKWTGKVPIL